MKADFFCSVVQYYSETSTNGNDKFLAVKKGMTSPDFSAWHVVYPISPFNFKWDMAFFFNKRQVPPFIKYSGKINYSRRAQGFDITVR